MKYNEQSLREAIIRIDPVYEALVAAQGVFMPRICGLVAEDCWVNQKPETEYTRLLRRALKDLAEKGHFDYQ